MLPDSSEWISIDGTDESDVLQRLHLSGAYASLTWYLVSSSGSESTGPLREDHRSGYISVNTLSL